MFIAIIAVIAFLIAIQESDQKYGFLPTLAWGLAFIFVVEMMTS